MNLYYELTAELQGERISKIGRTGFGDITGKTAVSPLLTHGGPPGSLVTRYQLRQ